MRLKFMASDKPRERDLGVAFCAGAKMHRVKASVDPLCASPVLSGADVVCMVGVKSKRLFNQCLAEGRVPIMLDKGYCRERRADARVWEYWRVSVGAHHPTETLMARDLHRSRLELLDVHELPWRASGFQIVIAGSSAKYHDFYDLPEPTTWAREVVAELRTLTDRPIIYRPKPSWDGAVPIEGTYFSPGKESISGVLNNAWAMVTHGSNASFEAALQGIPSIVLGNGIAKPISSMALADIEAPRMQKRQQWLRNLAYYQWTEAEFRSGVAWEFIGGLVDDYRAQHQGV